MVILDEPSSALDPLAEYNMYNNMMKLSEGKGVIFISHRLSSARMANKIYLMKDGQRVGKVNIDNKIYDWVISTYFDRIVEKLSHDFIVNFYWALDIVQGKEQ